MIGLFRRKLYLTHAISGKRIGIMRSSVSVVFEVEDSIKKLNQKCILFLLLFAYFLDA